MDSITQAALGATVGQIILGKQVGNKAAIIGAVLGTVPDLDVLLSPFISEFQKISLHRGYSHSILFCVVVAFIATYFLNRWRHTKAVSTQRLWIGGFLILFTHILLDVFTTYGTQVFLPFTDLRISFDSISIIDPVYTIPLLVGLFLSIRTFRKGAAGKLLPVQIGFAVSTLYLLFTVINKQQIEQVFRDQLNEQEITHSNLLTVPVAVGNMVWYGVAKNDEHLQIGKYSILDGNDIVFHEFTINDHLLDGLDEQLVDRMKWFAQGFYTVAEKDGKIRVYNMQCDMQGVRTYGDYAAPTAFYYEMRQHEDGTFDLTSGMHNEME